MSIEPIQPTRRLSPISVENSLPLPARGVSDVLSASRSSPAISVERPQLTPLSEYRCLEMMQQLKDQSDGITLSMTERLKQHKQHLSDVVAKNIQAIKENAERVSASDWWSFLKKSAMALLSAVSIAMGITLIAGGGSALIGGAMIASGILSIANFALSEAGVWDQVARMLEQQDEQRRKKIGMLIPGVIGVLSGAIGLFGGVQSLLYSSHLFVGKVLEIVQAALAGFQGVTTIGKGIADYNLLNSQGQLLGLKGQITIERHSVSLLSRWLENWLSEMKGINAKFKQMANMVIQANQKVVQG